MFDVAWLIDSNIGENLKDFDKDLIDFILCFILIEFFVIQAKYIQNQCKKKYVKIY